MCRRGAPLYGPQTCQVPLDDFSQHVNRENNARSFVLYFPDNNSGGF